MLTLLLALQAATAQPATLWQNVRAGMTLAELQAVRPSARPIPPAEKRNWLKGCDVADGKLEVEGVMFDVCYETQDGKVTAVLLHAPLVDHRGAADRFKPALATKYGQPMLDSCGGFDRAYGIQTCNTVWRAGAVTIKNDRLKVAGRHMIRLEYRAEPSQTPR
jgi:hypothetical protein